MLENVEGVLVPGEHYILNYIRSGEDALHAEERGGGLHPGGDLHPVHCEGDDRENGLVAEADGHEASPGDELLEDLREIEEVSGDPLADLGEDDGEDLKDLMEEVDDPGLSEGDVRVGTKLNAQWKKEMEAATKPFPIQNVTLIFFFNQRNAIQAQANGLHVSSAHRRDP